MVDLEEELSKVLGLDEKGFNSRLSEIEYDWQVQDIDVQGKFFYLNFKDGKPSLDEFVEYIYGQIIKFCIPYRERKKIIKKYIETEDDRYLLELTDKAKNLFIRAKSQMDNTGEPAELILFILMEVALKAPQIACKMYLKTSENMPVHGSDGIHVSFNGQDSMLRLYWGESKLYQQLSSALDEICVSLQNFTSNNGNGEPRQRDISILKDHMSVKDGELKEEILKYFDPYEPESNNVQEHFACFVGFNYSTLRRLGDLDEERFVEHFEEKYLGRIQSACNLFIDKIDSHSLKEFRFVFFLLPFTDVNELRNKFLNKLGVNP